MSSNKPTLLEPGSLRVPGANAPANVDTLVPLEYIEAWVRRRMPEYGGRPATLADRVLIVRAETGSGKSTALPVAIMRLLRAQGTAQRQRYRGKAVLCTQPRVLTARSLAYDVSSASWAQDMVLGDTVGYITGPFARAPPTGLIYATAGVLAAQLLRSEDDAEVMDRYRFIIVDEAHERSLDGDLTLMLLRHFLLRNVGNEQLPFVLLTSATFDTARYAAFFGVGDDNIIEVVGRQYPIEVHWPSHGTNDYPAEAAATAARIHAEHPDDPPGKGDILVFVPGAAAARAVIATLMASSRREVDAALAAGAAPSTFLVLDIRREVVNSEGRDFALLTAPPDTLPHVGGAPVRRRVIVSTVVAETGLTLESLRYVVDCGWSQTVETYPPWGASGLIMRPAPRSRVLQRKGRVGRLYPGDFYPLYTENVYAALDPQQLPDIVSQGADLVFLAIAREQQRQKVRTGRPAVFRAEDTATSMLTPPPPAAFAMALTSMVQLGFMSPRAALPTTWPPEDAADALTPSAALPTVGYGLTPLGHLAAAIAGTRMPPEGARAILASYCWGAATQDLVTVVAMFGMRRDELLTATERGRTAGLPAGAAALRAALPRFLAEFGYVGGTSDGTGQSRRVMPPTEEEAYWWRARLLIADDFVENLLIVDAAIDHLQEAATSGAHSVLADFAGWSAALGLDPEKLLTVLRRRDEYMEALIAAGLNPCRYSERRLAAATPADFTPRLQRLKRCLYDGLRLNLLTRDDAGVYRTLQGQAVQTPDLFHGAAAARLRALALVGDAAAAAAAERDVLRPRWLLTDQIALMADKPVGGAAAAPLLWTVGTGLVSVLSGYVDVDAEITGPRVFAAST